MTTSTASNNYEFETWYKEWLKEQKKKFNILHRPADKLLTNEYAKKVISGEILACNKVIQAAKRHINDMKRQGTNDFPWVFVEDKGHRPIRFIEKYCKPSKGDFDKLIMQPWQHFILGSLYGWVHKDTGIRRFREGVVLISRKNGKSGVASGISAFGASKDGERGADVYVLANSMKQVKKTIFDECKKMIKASPRLRKHFRVTRDAIYFDKTNSIIEPQASDSELLDGLNTHLGIFDEIHEFKDYKLINIVKKSRGSRKQPLILYITTAGYQLDGPLVNYYEQGSDVLEGSNVDERTFYFIAELDSVKEIEKPEFWIKANPNIGVTLDLVTLREDWEKDKRTPQERTDFITKQLNFFANNSEQSFLDFETLKKNNKEIDASLFIGKSCIGGFDLSDSEDFTSACLEFPIPETGEVFILSHSWVPQKKVDLDNEKIPFKEYEDEGLLTIIPGDYVKKEYIYDWFVEQSEKFHIQKIMYDPAKAFGLVESLISFGFNAEVVRQGHMTLGKPMDDLKERFLDGNIIFNNNRLFRWYINNVRLVEDRNRNKMPTRQGRYRKIDGFAAFLNAHVEGMVTLLIPPPTGSVEFISIKNLMGK